MNTNTGPAGIVSNSGASGLSSFFSSTAASPSFFSDFLARSATLPSAAGPDLPSAVTGGFNFFSSGLRPIATVIVLLSNVVSLNVRRFALAGATFGSSGAVVSENRILPTELSSDETLSAFNFWPAGVLSAVQGSSFFARETVMGPPSANGISIFATSSGLILMSSAFAQFFASVSSQALKFVW